MLCSAVGLGMTRLTCIEQLDEGLITTAHLLVRRQDLLQLQVLADLQA